VQVSPGVVTLATLGAAAVLAIASVSPACAEPDEWVARPLVLAAGAVDLRLTAEIDVRRQATTQLLSLAPDAWWGISPRWTLGIIHSDASVDQLATGASFCVRQSEGSMCDRLYRGGGLDVRFDALAGQLAIAPRLRFLIRNIEPFKPAVTLGALARWTYGRFAITSDPYVRLPLANHALGNRAALSLPLWLAIQPGTGWEIALHVGFDADFVVLRDGWHGPVALNVVARVTREVDVGVEAGWGSLLGPQHDAKHGAILITTGWHD
jgi:hypothetical protein